MTQHAERTRAVQILAKSIHRQLTEQGFEQRQIVALATELINQVTKSLNASAATAQ